MGPEPLPRRLRPDSLLLHLALLAGVLACAIVLRWAAQTNHPYWAYDDAYISYRYAQNLRDGHGMVYNRGEWVLGTTTPLYTAILALLGLAVPDIAQASHWLGAAGWAMAIAAAQVLLWREGARRAAVVAAPLLAVQYPFLTSLGMEAPVVMALMTLTAVAFSWGSTPATIVLGALLLLSRYDTALWLLVLGLWRWQQCRRLPWREAAGIVLIAAPWLAWSAWRYGAILPNSAMAKIGQGVAMGDQAAEPFVQAFVRTVMVHYPDALRWVWLFAFGIGLWYAYRRARVALWLAGWLATYLAIYSWLGPTPFPWYMVPPLLAGVVISSVGIGGLLGDGHALHRARAPEPLGPRIALPRARAVTLGAAGLAVAATLLTHSWTIVDRHTADHGHYAWSEYARAAAWLRENAPGDATIATVEIGILGYDTGRPILDTMGLVSDDIRRRLTGWSDTLVYAITAHWPEYAIVMPGTAWDAIVGEWWFRAHYRAVATIRGEDGTSTPVTIYERTAMPRGELVPVAGVEYVPGLALDGVRLPAERIVPGRPVDLWLHLNVLRPLDADIQVTAMLVDAQTGEHHAVTSVWPYGAMDAYPSSHWAAGDHITVPIQLEPAVDLPAGAYRLGVLLYDGRREQHVALVGRSPEDYQQALVGLLRAGDPPPSSAAAEAHVPVGAEWGLGVRLARVGLPAPIEATGGTLALSLEWTTLREPDREATVFVHLVRPDGTMVAQRDCAPFGGRFPLPVWQPGETLIDNHLLPVPVDLAPGPYELRVGLYDAGGRLALVDPGPGAQEGYVAVPLEVGAPGL